ncbi:MAG: hypothetical protein RLZZ31_1921 [Actinomycetota bacterium]|jgi:two-component system response regulator RegX3
MRVLLVEDEVDLANAIGKAFAANNIDYRIVNDGQSTLTIDLTPFDLIILDVGLPDINGFVICQIIRTRSPIPIIFLSGHDDEDELLAGFDSGGDDYVKKPFSMRELIARINAVVNRRAPANIENVLIVGDLELDVRRHRVVYGGDEVELTRKEFDLLELLVSHPNQLLLREEILDRVWGADHFGPMKTLDVHMATLRKKLPAANAIETVRGLGYRFVPRAVAGFSSS